MDKAFKFSVCLSMSCPGLGRWCRAGHDGEYTHHSQEHQQAGDVSMHAVRRYVRPERCIKHAITSSVVSLTLGVTQTLNGTQSLAQGEARGERGGRASASESRPHSAAPGELGVLRVREHPLNMEVHPFTAKSTPSK